ncbi:MAG TPA: cytochrome c [Gemmatimonadales bacterium]|nr:cytochrome c [Gemmatimonadales bacterium]
MAGQRWLSALTLAGLVMLAACGGEKAPPASSNAAPAASGGDLTPFQLENGIGPVTEAVTLGPLDAHEAEEGQKVFEAKCSACHKLGERYVGPPLGGILDKVTPAFAMNMMLNPQEMYTRHPVVKKLLGEYMTQMPNQGLTQDEAREVVEYLRTTTAPAAPAQ